MCLTSVEKTDLSSKIVHSGYKEFVGSGSSLRFENWSLKAGSNVPLDTWIKAEGPSKIKANDGKEYPAYFHIYETETTSYSKRRTLVYFRSLKTIGHQGEKVFVAEEMYVPSNPNNWPPQGDKKKGDGNPAVMSFIDKMSGLIDELRRTAANA